MTFLKAIWLVLIFNLVLSCSPRKAEEKVSYKAQNTFAENGNFDVAKFNIEFLTTPKSQVGNSEINYQNWSVQDQIYLRFVVDLTSVSKGDNFQGHDFEVLNEDGEPLDLDTSSIVTNPEGVLEVLKTAPFALKEKPVSTSFRIIGKNKLVWHERHYINPFCPVTKYIPVKRFLRGKGAYFRGQKVVLGRINPWASKDFYNSNEDPFQSLVTSENTSGIFKSELLKLQNTTSQSFAEALRCQDAEEKDLKSSIVVSKLDANNYVSIVDNAINRNRIVDTTRSVGDLINPAFQKNNEVYFLNSDNCNGLSHEQLLSGLLPAGADTSCLQPITQNYVELKDHSLDLSEPKLVPHLPDTVSFSLDLNFVLNSKYYPSNDPINDKLHPIDQGTFKLSAYLIGRSDGQRVILNPGVKAKLVSHNNQKLDARLDFEIPFQKSSGDIVLALRLDPVYQGVNNLGQKIWLRYDGLKAFEGLYRLGNYSQFFGKKSNLQVLSDNGDLTDPKSYFDDSLNHSSLNNTFDLEAYVRDAQKSDEAIKQLLDEGSLALTQRYLMDPFRMKFLTIESGETATQRTVIFSQNIKLRDGLRNGFALLDNKRFEVYSVHTNLDHPEDQTQWELVHVTKGMEQAGGPNYTKAKGNLFLFDKITHKYYKKEKMVERKYFVLPFEGNFTAENFAEKNIEVQKKLLELAKKPETDIGNLEVYQRSVYFNPWDEKYGTFAKDELIFPKSLFEEIQKRPKLPPRFFIPNYKYETLRFRYDIDEHMNLQVKKAVLLSFTPSVLRYSSILEGVNSVKYLRDGIYLLKVAMLKDYVDPAARGVRLSSGDPGGNTHDPEMIFSPLKSDGTPLLECNDLSKSVLQLPAGCQEPHRFKDQLLDSDDPRKKRFMSYVKKLVRVNGGKVITPIEFEIDDLRLMRIRSLLFLQIEPVNQMRLQITNLVSKFILEEVFGLRKNSKNSEVLGSMGPLDKKLFFSAVQKTIDEFALSLPDYILLKDLATFKKFFETSKVSRAMGSMQVKLKEQIKELLEKKYDRLYGYILDHHSDDPLVRMLQNSNVNTSELMKEISKMKSCKNCKQHTFNQNYRYLDIATPDELEATAEALAAQAETALIKKKKAVRGYDAKVETFRSNNEDSVESQVTYCEKDQGITRTENKIEFADKVSPSKCIPKDTGDKSQLPYAALMGEAPVVDPVSFMYMPFNNKIDLVGVDTNALSMDKLIAPGSAKEAPVIPSLTFMVEELATQANLDKIKLNDFTGQVALSDVSDLNILVDRDLDLVGRTFVGPITFLLNTNGGSLRPTDTLGESACATDDCNTSRNNSLESKYGPIKNFSYESSKYHGSMRYVQSLSFYSNCFMNKDGVKDYDPQTKQKHDLDSVPRDATGACTYGSWRPGIEEQFKYNQNYKKTVNNLASKMGLFLDSNNLDYISFRPEDRPEYFECLDKNSKDKRVCNKYQWNKNHSAVQNFDSLYQNYKDRVEVSNQHFQSLIDEDNAQPQTWSRKTFNKMFGSDENKPHPLQAKVSVVRTQSDLKDALKNLITIPESEKKRIGKKQTAQTQSKVSSQTAGKMNEDDIPPSLMGFSFNQEQRNFVCDIFINGVLGPKLTKFIHKSLNLKASSDLAIILDQLLHDCQTLTSEEMGYALNIERKLKVHKTGRYYYRGGKSMNINVAENMGISHSRYLGTDNSKGIGIPLLTKHSTKQGKNYNYNEGLSIAEGTYLVMQNTEFSLELTSYQECLIVKWNPLYTSYERDLLTDFDSHINLAMDKLGGQNPSQQAKIQKLISESGFASCNAVKGEKLEDRIVVRENFYYFTQHFTEGDMLDPANIHNHPWLYAIRGLTDFKKFMHTIHSVKKEDGDKFVILNDYFGNTDLVKDDYTYLNNNLAKKAITKAYKIKPESENYKWPIQQLVKSYNRLIPTSPGFYTQMDQASYAQGTWPNTSPDPAKDLNR